MIKWGNVTRHFENIECPMSRWQMTNRLQDYPYSFDIILDNIKETGIAFVAFDDNESSNGNYAPICETLDGIVRIYAKTIPFKNINIKSIEYVEK